MRVLLQILPAEEVCGMQQHAWTPWELIWQVMEMLQTPLDELLRCHLEQAAVAHKLILLVLLHVTMC